MSYLDEFNQNGVFIRHKQKMRSSVAVGTAERGRLSSNRLSCLGIVQLPRSGVDHVLYMANSTMKIFKPVSDVSVIYLAFSPFCLRRRHYEASLAACIPSSQYP
jgi:hypothetical protein